MENFTYTFPAILGVQNNRPFYQVVVPFRLVASLLKLDDDHDVNKRSQRLLEKSRAKKVAEYLVKNKEGFWILPPLVGYVEGASEFEELQLDGWGSIGRMKMPIDSRIKLFDGQHRAFGIKEVMALAPELGQENISIMFFRELTLAERQQGFHDINFTQKTPAKALCIAYNERSEFDRMVVDTFSQSNLRHLIEYEKNTASGKSTNVYSLKTLKDFSELAVGKVYSEEIHQKFTQIVEAVFEAVNVPAHLTYIEATVGSLSKHIEVNPAENYRMGYITAHAVGLKALGLLARFLLSESPDDLSGPLKELKRGTFSRGSDDWKFRCVSGDDKMVSNNLAVRLTYFKLKSICGYELDPEEQRIENTYFDKLAEAMK